jgi:hypothetical protein
MSAEMLGETTNWLALQKDRLWRAGRYADAEVLGLALDLISHGGMLEMEQVVAFRKVFDWCKAYPVTERSPLAVAIKLE